MFVCDSGVIYTCIQMYIVYIWPYVCTSYSWLYQEPEATVCDISEASLMMSSQEGGHSSNEQESSYLSVKVILTQAACSRFQAKFSQSVRMIEVNLPHTHKQ